MPGTVYSAIKRPPKKIIEAFRKLPTTIITDAMGRTNAMNAEIKCLIENVKVAGTAITVQCMVGDNILAHQAIYIAEQGDIIVIDAKGHKNTSMWGNIMSTACKMRGIEAVVIDGTIRDKLESKQQGFPVFCCGAVPAGPHKGWGGNINVPIQCGGVSVNPGDIIIGDDDGIAVVPQKHAEAILAKAKELKKMENEWLEKLEKGETTLEIIGLDKKIKELNIEFK